MSRTVQDEIRPRLSRVEGRGQELKTLSEVVGHLKPGTAVALLASPGVDLRRLAADVIRGLPDTTLIVWINLAELSRKTILGSDPDPAAPGASWDQLIDHALVSGFEVALEAEGLSRTELESGDENEHEDPGVARIQRFAAATRRLRRWPVLAIEGLHFLPWPVSERLQHTLRKALDNSERLPVLRLTLTSSSDFLSGEAIIEGGGEFGTSPLYARTTRYEVVPYHQDQLWELSPMPGGLPDELLSVLLLATGGAIGLFELFMERIQEDPRLGRWLLDAYGPGGETPPPSWFWPWMARVEPFARPARQLVREGLGALLSNPKGRSRQTVEALEALMRGEPVEEASADSLLPLELAGLAGVRHERGWYRYSFVSPLVPPLLEMVLPEGKHLRDRLEAFARTFSWEEPLPELPPPPPPPEALVRITGAGSRRHIMVSSPEGSNGEPGAARIDSPAGSSTLPGVQPARQPFTLPEEVSRCMADPSAHAARRLLELVLVIARAVEFGRRNGNLAILSPTQLDVRWVPMDTRVSGVLPITPPGAPPAGDETPASPGRWEVELRHDGSDATPLLEAAALFMPPERLPALIRGATSGERIRAEPSDDAFALGQLIGMLLAREPDPRLVLQRLQRRLVDAQTLGVGPLVSLVKDCLDPAPARRPSLESFIARLDNVLSDPYRTMRRVVRWGSYFFFILVVVLGLVDFALDARVDNPNWAYTGVKIVGAAGWAAFYFFSWLILGNKDKEQIHQQLFSFIRQRMNRVRWMIPPALVAVVFCALFAQRIYFNWGVQLSLPLEHTLEEIKERKDGEEDCSTVHRFATPVSNASLRLRLTGREYHFILDYKTPQGIVRRQFYWPAEQVSRQRSKSWGDTLEVYALAPPLSEKSCLPASSAPTGAGSPGAGTVAPAGGSVGAGSAAPAAGSPGAGSAAPSGGSSGR